MRISEGPAGVSETLDIMRTLAKAGRKSGLVRQLALKLTKSLPQKDKIGEIRALHKFVRDQIRYINDIDGVETLHTADQILNQAAGDCDDKSVLLSSLLGSIGKKTSFVATGKTPGHFDHVHVEVLIGPKGKEKWLPLETTEPVEVGWRRPNAKAFMRRIV